MLTADYTVIENVFPLASENPGSDISPAVKQGLSTRFPLAIRDDPSAPWVITNKAVRELGLKLQDEVALADLQKQLAAPVARVRQSSGYSQYS